MHQEKATLQRQLKPMHVWAVAFGCIVGWGSFINPGKKFLPNSGVAGTAIAMALGALVMIIIAFSYAYMVPKYPQAGGEFTFTKMCFGKRAAYVCGWFLVAAYLTNVPMNSTAIGLIVDGLDGSADILKFGFHYQIAGFDVWLGEMLLAMGCEEGRHRAEHPRGAAGRVRVHADRRRAHQQQGKRHQYAPYLGL